MLIKSAYENICLKTCSDNLPQSTEGFFFWSPSWTPFRGYWRSAAAAAHELIFVELDGKHPWQVQICSCLVVTQILSEAKGRSMNWSALCITANRPLSWAGQSQGDCTTGNEPSSPLAAAPWVHAHPWSLLGFITGCVFMQKRLGDNQVCSLQS